MSAVHIAYDDVTLSLIPRDAPFVLAYVDGIYANYDAAVREFGADKVRGITVHGAHGAHIYWVDCEPGDETNAQAISWVAYEVKFLKHTARGPYTMASNMNALIEGLANVGVSDSEYPTWSAHYGSGEHICGPHTCGQVKIPCSGTQFTNVALGRSLDETVYNDRWLGKGVTANPNAYPGWPVKFGDKGPVVAHIQQKLHDRGWPLKVDGVFGGRTLGDVQVFQRKHSLKADGIVGPQTWNKLFS